MHLCEICVLFLDLIRYPTKGSLTLQPEVTRREVQVGIETMLTVSQDNISQYCRTPLLNIIETALSLIFIVIISRIIF